jgi:hypothetical protein
MDLLKDIIENLYAYDKDKLKLPKNIKKNKVSKKYKL